MKTHRTNLLTQAPYIWAIAFLVSTALITAQLYTARAASLGNSSIKDIAGMLTSGDAAKQMAAATRLKEMGQTAMPELSNVLKTGQTRQRIGATLGLALMPIPELTIHSLTEALADSNAAVRSLAAHALAKIGTPAAQPVAMLLDSENANVQIGAGFALSKMGAPAVPALIHSLKSDTTLVRAKAAWILGRIGHQARPAVPALVRTLRTNDVRLLHVVAEAIDLIGAPPAMLSHELMLPVSIPSSVPIHLKRMGEDAAPTLVSLLSRPGTPIAQTAMYTLSRVGRGAIPALETALASGTPSQRTAAALLLNHMDPAVARSLPPELRETLAGALKSE